MLWKFIVDVGECENGTGHEFSVGAIAMFLKLFVVSCSCKSGGVCVGGGGGQWDECEKVGMSLLECYFVKEP